ncbi:MAG TPA: hypothetical protein VL424_03380, partial [Pararobbsia sp.]|nr:hypothetical protein [Pararobbsia sp.]
MEAILVINAGSSSIKFSAFSVGSSRPDEAGRSGVAQNATASVASDATRITDAARALEPIANGKIEELYENPHFIVKRRNGEVIDEKHWPAGERLGHDKAIGFLLDWLRSHNEGASLLAVGHRVVHGGDTYREPVRVDAHVIARLEALIPLAPLH